MKPKVQEARATALPGGPPSPPSPPPGFPPHRRHATQASRPEDYRTVRSPLGPSRGVQGPVGHVSSWPLPSGWPHQPTWGRAPCWRAAPTAACLAWGLGPTSGLSRQRRGLPTAQCEALPQGPLGVDLVSRPPEGSAHRPCLSLTPSLVHASFLSTAVPWAPLGPEAAAGTGQTQLLSPRGQPAMHADRILAGEAGHSPVPCCP